MLRRIIIGCVFICVLLSVSCNEKSQNKTVKSTEKEKIEISNYTPNPPSDFSYELSEDMKSVVLKSYKGTSPIVFFPTEIEGIPVKELCPLDYSYEGVEITTVIIPEGFEKIPDGFCPYVLSKLYLPTTLKEIGAGAFFVDFDHLVLPPNVTKLRGNFCGSFINGIKTIELPANLKKIDESAFCNSSIKEIVLPDSVESIEDCAFMGAELKSITLSKNLKKIGESAFFQCEYLEEVIIPEEIQKVEFVKDTKFNVSKAFCDCPKLSLKSQAALRRIGYDEDF